MNLNDDPSAPRHPGTLALSAPYVCALYAEPGGDVIDLLQPRRLVLVIASITAVSGWKNKRSTYRWNLLLGPAGRLGWTSIDVGEVCS